MTGLRTLPRLGFLAALALGMVATAPAAAESETKTAIFAVHVGINVAPKGSGLEPLRFADDDAARLYELSQTSARHVELLTTLDAESQRRYPGLPAKAKPPTLRGLRQALAGLKPKMERARADGDRVVLLFSYAGHGTLNEKRSKLTMLDGAIDRNFLERHVARLPADATHLILDACHAGGIVTGRGFKQTSAAGRRMARAEADRALGLEMFQRHPHVGALIATSPDGIAHEWSALEAGVFTYELVSALSGAADINGDGRVAYSEVGAFVAAANRAISDPRGRVGLVVEPPRQNQREPIFDRRWVERGAYLLGEEGTGRLRIERDDGLRLLDAHPGDSGPFALLVPTNRRLHISTPGDDGSFTSAYQKASVTLSHGERVWLGSLGFRPGTRLAKRGGLESALREGFFKKPYDRSYYEGYVDSRRMVAETFGEAPDGLTTSDDPAFFGGSASEDLPDEEFDHIVIERPQRRTRIDDIGEEQPFSSEGPVAEPEPPPSSSQRADAKPRKRPEKVVRVADGVRKQSRGGRTQRRRVREDGRSLLTWTGISLLGFAALGAGMVTALVGALTAFAMYEYATTPYQLPAAQALNRGAVYGVLTTGGVLTVGAAAAASGALWYFTSPSE